MRWGSKQRTPPAELKSVYYMSPQFIAGDRAKMCQLLNPSEKHNAQLIGYCNNNNNKLIEFVLQLCLIWIMRTELKKKEIRF